MLFNTHILCGCPEVSTPQLSEQNLLEATSRVLLPSLTLKLRLDLPGAGSKPAEHIAVVVLEECHAGPPVWDAAAELGEAVPMELG